MREENSLTSIQYAALLTLVIILGTGKVFASTGQIIFGIKETFDDIEDSHNSVNSDIVTAVVIIGAISNSWVRAVTRYPALWRNIGPGKFSISSDNNESPLFPENDKLLFTVSSFVFANGMIAGTAAGAQAYLGSKVLLNSFGVKEEKIFIPLSSLNFVCALAVYFSFVMQKTIRNSQKIAKVCRNSGWEKILQHKKSIALTLFFCGLGTFAFSAMAFQMLTDEMSNLDSEFKDTLGWIALVCTFIDIFLSRVSNTFLFIEENHKSTFVNQIPEHNKKTSLPFLFHLTLSLLDICTYGFAFYSGCIDVFSNLNLEKDSKTSQILSALSAISSAAMHFIFSVEPPLNRDGKLLIENSKNSNSIFHVSDNFENFNKELLGNPSSDYVTFSLDSSAG